MAMLGAIEEFLSGTWVIFFAAWPFFVFQTSWTTAPWIVRAVVLSANLVAMCWVGRGIFTGVIPVLGVAAYSPLVLGYYPFVAIAYLVNNTWWGFWLLPFVIGLPLGWAVVNYVDGTARK